MSLDASTTRDMAEKNEVIIRAVLEPSNRLLIKVMSLKRYFFYIKQCVLKKLIKTYDTTNGKIGDTIDAAVSGRLTSMLSITDITLISPSGRMSTICSIRTFTIREPYIWRKNNSQIKKCRNTHLRVIPQEIHQDTSKYMPSIYRSK